MPLGLEGIPRQHTSHAFPFRGGVAQSVERGSHKPYVGGSSPPAATNSHRKLAGSPSTAPFSGAIKSATCSSEFGAVCRS